MKITIKTQVLLMLFVFSCSNDSFSQEKKKPITFQGGMYYGSGYCWLNNEFGEAKGVVSGLGGRLHFNLLKHFRAGIMGNSVTLNYENSSYIKVTTVGLTAEAYYVAGRFNFAFGAFGGFCIDKNLHAFSRIGSFVNADFQKKRLGFISPMVTVSFQITQKISLALITDYLYSPLLSRNTSFNLLNARVGIFFNR
jgi:hypothetical protein